MKYKRLDRTNNSTDVYDPQENGELWNILAPLYNINSLVKRFYTAMNVQIIKV